MTQAKSFGEKARDALVLGGCALAIFTPIWFAIAALGTKFGLWPWGIGLLRMTGGIGVPLIGLLVLETFITSILVLLIKPRAGFAGLALMWVVSLGAAGMAFTAVSSAKAVPPIHDISTDPTNPLTFSQKVIGERGDKSNKIILPTQSPIPFNKEKPNSLALKTLIEIQAESYPQIKSLVIDGQAPAAVYAKALASVKQQGLTIMTEDAARMRIEAYAETFWFGFKDDVIIAVTPTASGSKVDMRSVSRVGMSDLGANAKRIEAFLAKLEG